MDAETPPEPDAQTTDAKSGADEIVELTRRMVDMGIDPDRALRTVLIHEGFTPTNRGY